jgi:hypothetical protein
VLLGRKGFLAGLDGWISSEGADIYFVGGSKGVLHGDAVCEWVCV